MEQPGADARLEAQLGGEITVREFAELAVLDPRANRGSERRLEQSRKLYAVLPRELVAQRVAAIVAAQGPAACQLDDGRHGSDLAHAPGGGESARCSSPLASSVSTSARKSVRSTAGSTSYSDCTIAS